MIQIEDTECEACGSKNPSGSLCPPCEDIEREIREEEDACPSCKRVNVGPPGEICEDCEDIRRELNDEEAPTDEEEEEFVFSEDPEYVW